VDTSTDWIALFSLVTRYSRALDTKDYALLKTCFTEQVDVTYDLSSVGVSQDRLTCKTRDEVVALAARVHKPLLGIMHRNSNQAFEIDGDRATGRVYVDVFQVRVEDRPAPQTTHHNGWYDDIFARTPEGWRFTERHFKVVWSEGTWLGAAPEA
jgi:hypothetical protein